LPESCLFWPPLLKTVPAFAQMAVPQPFPLVVLAANAFDRIINPAGCRNRFSQNPLAGFLVQLRTNQGNDVVINALLAQCF